MPHADSLPVNEFHNPFKNCTMKISGNIVDVVNRRIFPGSLIVENGKIISVNEETGPKDNFILPGFTDAHIHIESSMLIPSAFARVAAVHGTVATVSDPHEIANVLGLEGVRFMIRNGKKVPFKFFFGASSCVPATIFETAGAVLGLPETEELLSDPEILYLSEMMNFPGVLFSDPEVMGKLAIAKKYGKPVDGHAPGLKGDDAAKYAGAGITTDHECFTIEEALDKINFGMKILIREGSAARNFEALSDLIDLHPDKVMLCSDDRHPDDLVKGHINLIVKRALKKGYDLFDVLRSCTINPALHYNLDTGLLRAGDDADFIIADDLENLNILETWVRGEKIAENGRSLIHHVTEIPVNRFDTDPVSPVELLVEASGTKIKVITATDGELITGSMLADAKIRDGFVIADPEHDILKIVVKNRYMNTPVSVGFINGFGIKKGAVASCVAHDSHNIIAAGCDDESIAEAINMIIAEKGGIAVAGPEEKLVLPLPFAGIMTGEDGYTAATLYETINKGAINLGSTLKAPFMTLSFMALLVIPELKISDKGLFDGKSFTFTEIF